MEGPLFLKWFWDAWFWNENKIGKIGYRLADSGCSPPGCLVCFKGSWHGAYDTAQNFLTERVKVGGRTSSGSSKQFLPYCSNTSLDTFKLFNVFVGLALWWFRFWSFGNSCARGVTVFIWLWHWSGAERSEGARPYSCLLLASFFPACPFHHSRTNAILSPAWNNFFFGV